VRPPNQATIAGVAVCHKRLERSWVKAKRLGTDCLHLVPCKGKVQAVVNMVMNFQVSKVWEIS